MNFNKRMGGGRFDVFFIDNIVHKRVKKKGYGKDLTHTLKSNIHIFYNYINIIQNSYKNKYYGHHTVRGWGLEQNGNYKCEYIEGYRLDKINGKYPFEIRKKIKKQIEVLRNNLNENVEYLCGDWALHNLIYSIKYDKIINIDIEGFFTEPTLPKWGDIETINDWLDSACHEMFKNYFTLILWNPVLFISDIILKNIPNIIDKKKVKISKESLHDRVFDIYKLDTRCCHDIVLPSKIKNLKKYGDEHLFVRFEINNPTFINNINNEILKLKEKVRNNYAPRIKDYVKGIMIHIADNFEQSKYIWEKKSNKTFELIIQKAQSRYKITKIDTGKGWKTIQKINVYANKKKNTTHFFCA